MSTLLIILAVVFVLGPIAKAYAERLTREPLPESRLDGAEIARLQEELDRLSLEVARLKDEQSFMVRLLSEGDRKRLEEGRRSLD